MQSIPKRLLIQLGGDGRCDSPGHTAKYCTYSVMEQRLLKMLHFHVTNVAETDEGLIKVFEKLNESDVVYHPFHTDSSL